MSINLHSYLKFELSDDDVKQHPSIRFFPRHEILIILKLTFSSLYTDYIIRAPACLGACFKNSPVDEPSSKRELTEETHSG